MIVYLLGHVAKRVAHQIPDDILNDIHILDAVKQVCNTAWHLTNTLTSVRLV